VLVSQGSFLQFQVPTGFHVEVPNSRHWPQQILGRGETAYTGNRTLIRTILGPWRNQVEVMSGEARLEAFELSALKAQAGKRLLFLLPGEAIGDNVGYFLFLRAAIEQLSPKRVAVFNAGAASDIYRLDRRIDVFPLWITTQQLKSFDRVFDLLEVPALRELALRPCDPEGPLCDYTQIAPSLKYQTKPATNRKPASIALFPLASSPMRSLPIGLCQSLIKRIVASDIGVTVYLNEKQRQSLVYSEALSSLQGSRVKIHSGCRSLAELLSAVADTEFGVFCDSGPAHLTKLFGTRGLAIHTSADAKPLRGRFSNLQAWQSGYAGRYCTAPCGLAGPWMDVEKRIGCMGSLGVPQGQLTARAVLIDDRTNRSMISNPIPCVAHLNESQEQIWHAIEASWSS